MKILIQSLLFILVVGLFAVTSDRLNQIENKEAMNPSPVVTTQSSMSDEEFLTKMIEHHEEAIAIAQEILLPTDRPEIHDLATKIINTQTKEITLMKEWRRDWYGK